MYLLGPPGATAPRITERALLPAHLEKLQQQAVTLAKKAAAHAGTPDQADRLQALLAELDDLSTAWPDPSGRLSPRTIVNLSNDPRAWQADDPSFTTQAHVAGHLSTGKQSIVINGETVKIYIKQVRRAHGSQIAEAYATRLTA
jgi:hypothetical protein